MRRTLRIRPTAVIPAVVWALLGAVVLTGCGAGQVSQTARQVTAVNGANGNAGPIAVRNAMFPLPEGAEGRVVYRQDASAPIEMVIVNAGDTADELVKVGSPDLGEGDILGGGTLPPGQSLFIAGTPIAPIPGAVPGESPSATRSAAPTATPSATPAAGLGTSAEAGPPASTGTRVVLIRLTKPIESGLTYEIVLTFRNAGDVRLAVPVASSEAERKDEHAE